MSNHWNIQRIILTPSEDESLDAEREEKEIDNVLSTSDSKTGVDNRNGDDEEEKEEVKQDVR